MAQDWAKQFYNSAAWRRCQAAFLKSKYYLCERCGKPAYIVHHKQHLTPLNITNPHIALSWGNLEACCLDCHNAIHGNTACVEGVSFDANGDLIFNQKEAF
jgi:hypothetical protein